MQYCEVCNRLIRKGKGTGEMKEESGNQHTFAVEVNGLALTVAHGCIKGWSPSMLLVVWDGLSEELEDLGK